MTAETRVPTYPANRGLRRGPLRHFQRMFFAQLPGDASCGTPDAMQPDMTIINAIPIVLFAACAVAERPDIALDARGASVDPLPACPGSGSLLCDRDGRCTLPDGGTCELGPGSGGV